MLPKTETAGHIQIPDRLLTAAGRDIRLIGLIESARGLAAVEAIATATPRLVGLMMGAADMAADLGTATAWEPLAYARSRLIAACALADVTPIDSPFFDIHNEDGLKQEFAAPVALGFAAKAAIHPAQIGVINAALTPSAETVEKARAILAENAKGVGTVGGQMIDEAVARTPHPRRGRDRGLKLQPVSRSHPDEGDDPMETILPAYKAVGERRYRETSGLYWEDFEPGHVFEHRPGRTVLDVDNTYFTLLTLNVQPVHFDAAYAAKTEWKRPLVDSTFTLALITGMSVRSVSAKVVANLGWDKVKATHPVFAGDTLYAESTVLHKRESKSRPTQGIVTVSTRGINQDGAEVMSFERTMLIYRRGHSPEEAANH